MQDKLENQIHNFIMETYREPNIIVMHPQTWEDLVEDVTGKDSMAINKHDPNMRYRGYKVLRSLDLIEGEFEM